MKYLITVTLMALVVVVPSWGIDATPAHACAMVGRSADGLVVQGEQAVILWDGETQTFIRQVNFATKDKDFGFIVPSPGQPELQELDLEVLRYVQPPKPRATAAKPNELSAKSVTVVAQLIVAGMDATVLKASDANALGAWLKQHGYVSSEALKRWYEPFVAKGWYLTAFKLSQKRTAADSAGLKSSAVMMRFKTLRPFFPYDEPEGANREGILRVDLISATPMTAELQAFRPDAQAELAWSSFESYSGSYPKALPPEYIALLAKHVPGFKEGFKSLDRLWVTEFSDSNELRPGAFNVVFRSKSEPTLKGVPLKLRP